MTESKRTVKSRRAPRRAPRRQAAEPPVIEQLPLHKEAYYAGLGLADLAAEGAARLSAQLRRWEKQLVTRGQKRSPGLNQSVEGAREAVTRRAHEVQQSVQRGVREMWSALRGVTSGENTASGATPGTT